MKTRKLFNLFSIVTMAAVGAFAIGAGMMNKGAERVEAATSTTVYYAVSDAVVGSYTVKCNVNRQGDANNWMQYNMTKNGKTVNGLPVYTVTFTDLYDGLGGLQFQLYEGSTWKSQVQPISSWTSVSTYNGKLWVHGGSAWQTYTPDTVTYKVTLKAVKDGIVGDTLREDTVGQGNTYAVPAKIYQSGYSFVGWYTDSSCTTPYTAQVISANMPLYAKYVSASFSGSIHIDLKDSGWAEADASYAVLLMDKTTYSEEVTGWSSYVTGTSAGEHLVTVPYSLGFEPLEMTVVRYNPAKTDWATEKWTDTWGQTPDIAFGEMVRIGNTYDEGKNISYVGYPKVTTWSPSSADIFLNSVKLNGLNNTEYYSPTVTLAENQEFKVQAAPYADGDYHGSYSTHASIENNFKTGESGNIVCVVPGIYAFYFDGLADSIYITKVEIAEADEWAQAFLGADCAATKSSWSASANSYGSLSAAAKAILSGAEHVDHNVEVSGFVERAVQRYDYLIERYGKATYNDFMGRDGVKITSGSLASADVSFIGSNDSGNLIIMVSVVSLVSASTLIGLIVIKRRRSIAK